MPATFLDLTVRESRPGGPWGHKFSLRIRLREDTLVWDVKTHILEQKEGYDPAGARLYYLGVPMANCRTLAEYHVGNMGTLHIMRGAQGCVEAGKSCICATQLQHVLEKNRKSIAAKEEAEKKDQTEKLAMLVSASSREEALSRVLALQVESVVLLASSRSVHNTEAAVAAMGIAEKMLSLGADPTRGNGQDSPQQIMKRLITVLYPRFRKVPPMVGKLASLLGVKPARRREDELDVDADTVTDEHGLDVLVSEMPQPAEAKAADINNAALASTTDEATDEALVDYDGTVALNTTAEDSDAAHESGAAQARTTSQALTPETA